MGKIDNYLRTEIVHYLRDFYEGEDRAEYMEVLARIPSFPMLYPEMSPARIAPVPLRRRDCIEPEAPVLPCDEERQKEQKEEIVDLLALLKNLDDNFAVTLLKLIDVKGMDDVECYKKANVSKQTWYKIMNEKDYKPSRNTVISFAVALGLNLEETNALLATVGFTLSRSSKADVIVSYFLENGIYDILKINDALFEFDQPLLSV